jgi:hypothetical protein
MKKVIIGLLMAVVFIACGDNDEEDFDPTRLDIVTGINVTNSSGQIVQVLGNPNVSSNGSISIFPKPAFETIRIVANSSIRNIWMVRGTPSRAFFDTNFQQVFADNPFQQSEVEASSFRAFENLNGNNIDLNLADINQGYYRVFVQLENNTIVSDNIYLQGSSTVDINDINFWD